jgi:hypothetical protein
MDGVSWFVILFGGDGVTSFAGVFGVAETVLVCARKKAKSVSRSVNI